MDQFFKSLGILAFIAGLIYGGNLLFQNYEKWAMQFFSVIGIIATGLAIGYLFLRLIYGKNWVIKAGSGLYFGSGLISSTKQLVHEVKERDLQEETIAKFVSHIIWRVTRIGIIGILLAGLPLWLLLQQNGLIRSQNELFEFQNQRVDKQTGLIEEQTGLVEQQTELLRSQDQKFGTQNDLLKYQNSRVDSQISLMSFQNILLDTQNYRLNLQNNLIEAERRGALVILMSNIMDQMNDEIKLQEGDPNSNDSLGYTLSDPLIGRISALSQSFLPYRYLEGDTLTEKAVSPERGQLLLSLVKSNLDSLTYDKIFGSTRANFGSTFLQYALLVGANLRKVFLRDANLHLVVLRDADLTFSDFGNANLRDADLRGANFTNANLEGAFLINTDLTSANLSNASLNGAYILGAMLYDTNLSKAELSGAYLYDSYLYGAVLVDAELSGADFRGTRLWGADLRSANLSKARNLTFEQLLQVKTLYQCRYLDQTLKKQLRATKPCLFEDPEGPKACK